MSEVSDQYYSVELPSKGVFKSKGSKFYGYLFHCADEESFKVQLDFIKTQEPSARHYCWALRIHPETLMERSSDDGEPAHTAELDSVCLWAMPYCYHMRRTGTHYCSRIKITRQLRSNNEFRHFSSFLLERCVIPRRQPTYNTSLGSSR